MAKGEGTCEKQDLRQRLEEALDLGASSNHLVFLDCNPLFIQRFHKCRNSVIQWTSDEIERIAKQKTFLEGKNIHIWDRHPSNKPSNCQIHPKGRRTRLSKSYCIGFHAHKTSLVKEFVLWKT